MLKSSAQTLYLTTDKETFTGVFSSQEKARAVPHDGLTEINPLLLDGSPCSGKYVCMTRGVQTVLRREGNSFSTLCFDLGPFWTINPQSAAAALAGRNIEVDTFLLFEIDREYGDQPPVSLHREFPFAAFFRTLSDPHASRPDDFLITDYISLYFENQRRTAEYAEAAASPELKAAADLLMQAACRKATSDGRVIRCGFHVSHVRRSLEHTLLHRFSREELKRLSALLTPDDPASPNKGDVGLLRRAAECVPHIMTSRPLKDYLD